MAPTLRFFEGRACMYLRLRLALSSPAIAIAAAQREDSVSYRAETLGLRKRGDAASKC